MAVASAGPYANNLHLAAYRLLIHACSKSVTHTFIIRILFSVHISSVTVSLGAPWLDLVGGPTSTFS